MSVKIRELKEERAQAVENARKIHEKADTEKRQLNTEEQSEFDKLMTRSKELAKNVRNLEELEQEELEARSIEDRNKKKKGDSEERDESSDLMPLSEEERSKQGKLFRKYIKEGRDGLSPDELRFIKEINGRTLESREMSAFGDGGASMLAPQEFTTRVLENLGKRVAIRKEATVIPINTLAGFYAPTMDPDDEDAEWTPELKKPGLAADFEMGRRELRPNQLAKRQLLPITLLQSSSIPIEQIASDRLSAKIARTEEKGFNTGDGARKPVGLFTASDFGIPTSRDFTVADDDTVNFDDFIGAKRMLRSEYRGNAKWYLSDDVVTKLLLIKDGDGHYIWEASIRAGEPDIILGRPYFTSDYIPNTLSTGKYFAMFGDFSYYWIVDFAFTYLQRLNELYAETNQIALIIRRWTDGAPVLPEAFVRMKFA